VRSLLKNINVAYLGGEAGVDCADAVSERMSLRTNGTHIANRRDKKVQQEMIIAAGMRGVRQAAGQKFEDVVDFLQTEVSVLSSVFCFANSMMYSLSYTFVCV
jgi:hypothetical protein